MLTPTRTTTLFCGFIFAAGSFIECSGQETEPDLSVPIFEPNDVVWLEDWKPKHRITKPTREAARTQLREADQLKSRRKYDEAEEAYKAAMRIDPLYSYAPYQLACNYELAGKHEQAKEMFDRAMKTGFSDFPTALTDNELGKIRDGDEFTEALVSIRKRYLKKGMARVGEPIAVKPKGEAPEDGWPLILLLHGYGDSNESYVRFATEWAELGWVCVALPGSIPGRTNGFMWADDSTELTLRDIRKVVSTESISSVINKEKVFLLGFSQGALHAMLLAAKYREEFAGVVTLSPGGSLARQMITPQVAKGRPGKMVFIHGDKEPHAPISKRWSATCLKAGWDFLGATHSGGHQFPSNWNESRPDISKFLLEGARKYRQYIKEEASKQVTDPKGKKDN